MGESNHEKAYMQMIDGFTEEWFHQYPSNPYIVDTDVLDQSMVSSMQFTKSILQQIAS